MRSDHDDHIRLGFRFVVVTEELAQHGKVAENGHLCSRMDLIGVRHSADGDGLPSLTRTVVEASRMISIGKPALVIPLTLLTEGSAPS